MISDYDSDVCSIARSSAIFGDRWSLLILRDIVNGVRRFDAIARHLGVSREVLARRLTALVDGGVLERVSYRDPGSRLREEYRLTEAGLDLIPILLALMAWGDRYLADGSGPPVRVLHDECGAPASVDVTCSNGHEVSHLNQLRLEPGPGARPIAAV